MKRLLPVLMVAMLLVVACGSSSVVGKWYHVDDDGSYLELTRDGKVLVAFPDYEGDMQTMEVGTYEVKGNKVEMLLWGEETVIGTVSGDTMIVVDDDGIEDEFRRR